MHFLFRFLLYITRSKNLIQIIRLDRADKMNTNNPFIMGYLLQNLRSIFRVNSCFFYIPIVKVYDGQFPALYKMECINPRLFRCQSEQCFVIQRRFFSPIQRKQSGKSWIEALALGVPLSQGCSGAKASSALCLKRLQPQWIQIPEKSHTIFFWFKSGLINFSPPFKVQTNFSGTFFLI